MFTGTLPIEKRRWKNQYSEGFWYFITLSPDLLKELGWTKGQKLKMFTQSKTIFIEKDDE